MASICLVGLNYAPEPIGIGPYTQGWAEALAARGHRVRVICGVPYYPQWAPLTGYSEAFRRTIENGVEIMRVPHYIPANPTAARRLIHYASFPASAARGMRSAATFARP